MTGIVQSLIGSFGSVVSAVTDAYFNLVTLLLPGNGTNGAQNNTFLDSSTNNFTITRNGNTTQGTFSPFSQTGWSNYFNGSSQLTVPSTNGPIQFGTSAFTIEFWIYPADVSTRQSILATTSGSGTGPVVALSGSPSGAFGVGIYGSADTVNTGASAIVANKWQHVAVVRNSTATNDSFIYVDGVLKATGTISTNFSTAYSVSIGQNGAGGEYFTGYISNLRVVKGTAVYTAAFTPPTSALTAITNTSLLTCQSNRFIDNSSNAFAITVNGTPSVQAFSPFAPTAAYSAATNGGSGYFDGTGDYLSGVSGGMPSGQGTAFTLQTWVYVTSLAAARVITRGDSPGRLEIRIDTNGSVSVDNVSTATICATAAGAVRINAWTHIAITRTTGNIYTIYINAVSSATSSAYSTSITANDTIGYSAFSGSNYFVGYMSGFRVTTTLETISVPTAPPTAITGTSLLLNFTNAGITDATAKNDLETVGNAQISTTQSKFGGSSMYFDGTGDALPIPNNPWMRFGTGDFTIEAWIYPTATGDRRIVSIFDDSNNQFIFRLNNSTNTIAFNIITGGSSIVNFNSSSGVTLNTWTHVAAVRSGSTFTIYINGTSAGTGTSSSSFPNYTSRMWVSTYDGTNEPFNGYIDDLRITRYARYTSNFTAPTAAFPLQ